MINFNLFGGGFQHVKSSTLYKIPKYIIWDYNSFKNDITFFVDASILTGLKYNLNKDLTYGWLLESKFIEPNINSFCLNNIDTLKNKYKYIFTHNDELIKLDNEFYKFCPANGTWISELYIRDKSKLISAITSNKNYTPGHKIRLDILNKYKEKIDIFGRGFNEIKYKEEGLNDYMFSFVIENGIYDTYFTEKILDCFATGTIPIYLGTPKIKEYFNQDGIIFLDEIFNIENLTSDLYYSKLKAINQNLNIVKNFVVTEDWLYKKYFI